MTGRRLPKRSWGLSLLELLVVLTILGILAALALPRLVGNSDQARETTCQTLRGNIDVQAQLWFRHQGSWPAADLTDMMADARYFPEGPVTCPVDGSSYQFDAATRRVVSHSH